MTQKQQLRPFSFAILFILAALISACTGGAEPYSETFECDLANRATLENAKNASVQCTVISFNLFA
jgi:hypothetical protein